MDRKPFADWLRAQEFGRHLDAARALGVTRSRFSQIASMPYATPYIAWILQDALGLEVPSELVRGRRS